jgi:hypothetical protein
MQSRKLVKSVVKMQKKISYDKSLLIIQKLKKIKKLKKIIPVGSIRRKEKKNKDIQKNSCIYPELGK